MSLKLLVDSLPRFPTVGLCTLPTPLAPLKNLSRELGGPMIWEKREDMTGQGMGGNKLRKLDPVLHQASAQGADTLVSCGVVQSNSQRQVAAAAAKLGLGCHLAVYHGGVTPPTSAHETSGNALLNRLYGAILHNRTWSADWNEPVKALVEELVEGYLNLIVLPLRGKKLLSRTFVRTPAMCVGQYPDCSIRQLGLLTDLRCGKCR